MGVKRVLEAFVVLSALAVVALSGYHYYVEGKTPSSSVFDALEEYNGVMYSAVTAILDAADDFRIVDR